MRYSGDVLVAEDNPSNQMLIKLLLGKMGFEATIADDGQIAVDVFDSKPFRLVLMDMMMPNMNGYEATRTLRQRGVDVPIIAVTANAMAGDREKCLEAGCDEYVAKPITKNNLENAIAKFLQSEDGQALVIDEPKSEINSDSEPIVSELGDDPDLSVVAEMFVERLGDILENIKKALDSCDLAQLKDLFHEIKGAGGSAGFPILTERSAYIESLVKTQKTEEMKIAIEDFFNICKRVHAKEPVG